MLVLKCQSDFGYIEKRYKKIEVLLLLVVVVVVVGVVVIVVNVV